MASMIGVDQYLSEGIDFLFNSVVGRGDEIKYHEEEKKLRAHLENSNDIFTSSYKRNIVNIFLALSEKEEVKISFFHLYFFAKYFPHYLDVNLDGNFMLSVNEFSLEDLVKKLEDEDNKFEFINFFYQVINHIDNHKLEMSTYTKIKELFSDQIQQLEKNANLKKRSTPKIVVRKNSEIKEKKIYKRLIQKKQPEADKKFDKLIHENKSIDLDKKIK